MEELEDLSLYVSQGIFGLHVLMFMSFVFILSFYSMNLRLRRAKLRVKGARNNWQFQ